MLGVCHCVLCILLSFGFAFGFCARVGIHEVGFRLAFSRVSGGLAFDLRGGLQCGNLNFFLSYRWFRFEFGCFACLVS